MKIVLLAEGDTEKALRRHLKRFLDARAAIAGCPPVGLQTKDIMTLDAEDLGERIQLELERPGVVAVVGLIDVYPEFSSAQEAKDYLRRAAGEEPRFYAHAAQYDVEAWLLPYWGDICARIGVHHARPGAHPETVDAIRPPSKRLEEIYRLAKPPRKYSKRVEMEAILRDKDLAVAAGQCPELKGLLNTLLVLSGLTPLS